MVGVAGVASVVIRDSYRSSSFTHHSTLEVFDYSPDEFIYDETLEEELFSKGGLNKNPIFDAVRRKNRLEAEKMFKNDKSLAFSTTTWRNYNVTILDIALGNNDLPMTKLIVQQQISQDPLLERNRHLSSKKFKLFAALNPNVHESRMGRTPLYNLIKGCNLPAIESLIEHVKTVAYPNFQVMFLPYLHLDVLEIVYSYHVPSEVNKLISIGFYSKTNMELAIQQIDYWKNKVEKWDQARDISINIVKLLIHNEADLLKSFNESSGTGLDKIRSLTAENGAAYNFQDEIRFAEAEQKAKQNETCVIF